MKTVLYVAGFLVASCTGGAQPGATLDFPNPPSLVSQLRQLQHSINPQSATALRSTLPSAWRVRTADRGYSISTTPLRALLNRADSNQAQTDLALSEARTWLDLLASQLEGYSGATPPCVAGPREASAHPRASRIRRQCSSQCVGSLSQSHRCLDHALDW